MTILAAAATLQNPRSTTNALPSPRISNSITTRAAPVEVTNREQADRKLLTDYCLAVRLGGDTFSAHKDSTMGQWLEQRNRAFRNPQFLAWAKENSIDLRSIKLFPATGELHATLRRVLPTKHPQAVEVQSTFKSFSLENDPGWKGVAGPLITASKPMTGADNLFVTYPEATRGLSTNLKQIASFYRQPTVPFPPTVQQVTELEQQGRFIDPAASQARDDARTKDMEETLLQLGKIETLQSASRALLELAKNLGPNSADFKNTISQRLQSKTVTVTELRPGKANDNPTREITLERLIKNNGWNYPHTVEDLEDLAEAIIVPPVLAPEHGNYTGALGWPVPLTKNQQRDIYYEFLNSAENHDEYGVLGSLTKGVRWEASELKDPDKMLKKILASRRAQALGNFIQGRVGSVSTSTSKDDHALAALHISLDPSSVVSDTPVDKNKIVGFNLVQKDNWGLRASEVIDKFTQHLVCERVAKPGQTPRPSYIYVDGKKRASVETAPVAARLLLARHAPEFLVKNIPDSVRFGDHSWVSLKAAVARLELQAPGCTASMDYKEVMVRSSTTPITPEQELTELYARHDALKDWGRVNGFLSVEDHGSENPARMKQVYEEYNAQIATLRESSNVQLADLPDYKDLCLKVLRGILGDNVPLEKKCITLHPAHMDYVGPYSLLDLFMSDEGFTYPASSSAANQFKPGQAEVIHRWISTDPSINMEEVLEKIDENDTKFPDFGEIFSDFCDKYENSLRAQTKHLISQLPLEDRKNFEYGAITLHHEQKLTVTPYSYISSMSRSNPSALIIKITRDGQTFFYELDSQKSRLSKRNVDEFTTTTWAGGTNTTFNLLKPVTPKNETNVILNEVNVTSDSIPKSFNSSRSSYIAEAMVENSTIRSLEEAARGVTTFDTQVPFYKKLNEFMLNLIPLRSAIVAFSKGDIAEGIMDLVMDAFGFAVGLGAAAKSLKGLSALAKVGRGLRVVGRAAISAANPFDIIPSAARGLYKAGKSGYQGIKAAASMTDSYDLLSAAQKYDGVAFGTFKVDGHFVKGDAVLTGGKWHTYDPISRQPYGAPLDDFAPALTANSDELANWKAYSEPQSAETIAIGKKWQKLVEDTKTGPNKKAFENGYNTGTPHDIPGYSSKMKSEQVRALTITKTGLTPEQVGTLARQHERLAVQHGLNSSSRFSENVSSVGATLIPSPQAFYLSQVTPLSRGQCSAISQAMAEAITEGKEMKLIGNLFEAAADPVAPASRTFTSSLTSLQTRFGTPTTYHGTNRKLVFHDKIVEELADANATRILMMSTPDHAMIAGVRFNGAEKQYFFFDPNFGLTFFPNAETMKRGLNKVFMDKKLPVQYTTHNKTTDKLSFEVSVRDEDWATKASVHKPQVTELYDKALPPSSKPSTSVQSLAPVLTPSTPKAERVFIPEFDSTTIQDASTLLYTRGISDCSAIVILSDLKGGIYQKRTLMHLRGSTLNDLQAKALRDAQAAFGDGGAKLILVGGDNTRSTYAMSSVLNQEHKGETLLRDLATKHPDSISITTASGIDVNPDGTFKLIEGNHPMKKFTSGEKQQVFNLLD